MPRPRFHPIAAQLLLGIAGLALTTFICFQVGFGLARTAFIYVIVVALLSLFGSFSASVVLSLLVIHEGAEACLACAQPLLRLPQLRDVLQHAKLA